MDPHHPTAATPAAAARDPRLDLSPDERRSLQARDEGALGRFFDLYFEQVHGYVRRLLRDEHTAEDVTQDIFMHLHRALPGYDPERPLRPWVFTIATNKVRDHWRSRRHRDRLRETSVDDETTGVVPESTQRGPSEQLSAGELSDVVAAAVEDMPEILRTTFVLRFHEGLSFADIGAMVDRSEVAVRKRYSRALEELRQSLAGHAGSLPGAVPDPPAGRGGAG